MAALVEIERTDGDVTVVVIHGEHDLATAGHLRTRLDQALAVGTSVVVDLTPATFIDSAVLRVLLSGRDRAEEAGLAYLVAVGDQTGHAVTRLLELTGLGVRLRLVHGRDAAIAAAATAAA